MRLAPVTALAVMAAVSASSCGDSSGKPATEDLDREGMPTMVTHDVETFISDSGITRYHITTVLWKVFDEVEEPYWKFPDGLFLEKYDDNLQRDATVEADSATYFSNKRLWRLDGNVRMVNTAGDLFLTNQIFWDQIKHEVYSDSFIHIERTDRTIEGYGFESNDQMTAYTVRNPSGIFPANRPGGEATADTAATDTVDDKTAVEPIRTQPSRTAPSRTPRSAKRAPDVNSSETVASPIRLQTKAAVNLER